MNNKKINIIIPIIISLSISFGIIIGNFLAEKSPNQSLINIPQQNKLNTILDYIEKEYVDSISKSKLVEEAIPQILKNLDPHSVYIPASELKEVNESLEGNFEGIGVQFNLQQDTIYVVNTIPGGPAEKVGVLAGDRIIAVDDSIIAGTGLSNSQVIKLLKGEKGTEVKVGIKRKGVDELIDFTIIRDKIPMASMDISYMIDETIGYMKLSKFARTTYTEFKTGAADLLAKGMKKMILDLRGNGGGYLDAATRIIDEFLEAGKLIVYTSGKAQKRHEIRSSSRGILKKIEVVVLIDEFSASASEIVAGAVQDNDRGTIIGRRSFGKGLVQEQTVFNDNSALRLTIARYYTPTGRCIQKPYKDGIEEYNFDINERYLHGEFMEKDSIKLPDSLKYFTPEGKVVYGGGGIMPDIFVPVDTQGVTDYLIKIRNKGLIYKFALNYADKNRQKLLSYKTPYELEQYLSNKKVINELISFCKESGVPINRDEINQSKEIIKTQLHAYIARNILDDKGFYPIFHKIDNTLHKAINELNKK